MSVLLLQSYFVYGICYTWLVCFLSASLFHEITDLIAITERCLSGLNVTEGTPNCCEYYQTNSDVRMGQFSFTCSPSGELSSNNGTDGGFLHDGTLTGSTMDAARPSSSGSELPAWLGHELLEEVRKNTKLSYAMSKVAVETVLGCVASRMPRVADVMDGIVQSMHVKVCSCFCALLYTITIYVCVYA